MLHCNIRHLDRPFATVPETSMKPCSRAWDTSNAFLRRLADLSAAHIDGSIRRTGRYSELYLRQLAAHWPLALAPGADELVKLNEVSRETQDELFEDSCNLLQIAFMLESELMYWGDCLVEAWTGQPGPDRPH